MDHREVTILPLSLVWNFQQLMNALKPLVGDPSKRLGEAFMEKINHKDPLKNLTSTIVLCWFILAMQQTKLPKPMQKHLVNDTRVFFFPIELETTSLQEMGILDHLRVLFFFSFFLVLRIASNETHFCSSRNILKLETVKAFSSCIERNRPCMALKKKWPIPILVISTYLNLIFLHFVSHY